MVGTQIGCCLIVLFHVDSFDHYNITHAAQKYSSLDDPHSLETISGTLHQAVKRTGLQSFRGTLTKWVDEGSVHLGIAFHSTTIVDGQWIKIWRQETSHFYMLSYNASRFIVTGVQGQMAGPVNITILDGWNYLEVYAELHNWASGEEYQHEVKLNGETIFFGVRDTTFFGANQYVSLLSALGNRDDFYVVKGMNTGLHWGFLGPVQIHRALPIANGTKNSFVKRFPQSVGLQHYKYVDEISPDGDNSYLQDNDTNDEETFSVRQLDPLLLNILGFQFNTYAIGKSAAKNSNLQTLKHNFPTMQHKFDDPFGGEQISSTFDLKDGPLSSLDYQYYTKFHELSFVNGGYINSSAFGFKISTGNIDIARVSQFCIEVVVPFQPELPDIDVGVPVLIAATGGQVFKFAKLWKLDLLDGTQYRFTNHNLELTNPVDGLVYTPLDSLSMSAKQRRTGLDPASSEAAGIVGTLTYNLMLAGKLRGATITEYVVDWQYAWAGPITVSKSFLDTLSFDGAKWSAELSSIEKKILLPKGDVYGRTCRHVLGDEFCKTDLSLLEESGFVLTVTNNHTRFVVEALGTVTDAFGNDKTKPGYWAFGNLTWTTGDNIGLSSEIRTWTGSDGSGGTTSELILQIPMPFVIQVPDAFTITPGCDKTLVTCKTKFRDPDDPDNDLSLGNQKNYGGFPTIPGKDGIFAPLSGAERTFSLGDLFGGLI